jgi:transcriptional regulator with XRE-family HTH domain
MKFTFLDFMELSEKIKELRKKRDWSQEIVANKLNISLNSYGALERGETDIKLSRLEELAGIFEVDISFFFINDSEKNSRRKGDMNRRLDDITIEDYHLLEIEKYKLERDIEINTLAETIERLKAILIEKKHQIDFLENALKKVLPYINQ